MSRSYDHWLEEPYQAAEDRSDAFDAFCEFEGIDPSDDGAEAAFEAHLEDTAEADAERHAERRAAARADAMAGY